MARVLMVQGTMSNAGKSLLVAGLCRLYARRGYRVAPFKSQNMALNSYVTGEGLEIGRAQAMQAQACGIAPSVDMNPILLKPTGDMKSQVIVRGRPLANMRARDYFRCKKSLIPQIMESYERLAAEHDIILVEGAGSPAEINLREDDIVNMGLAKILDAPVLLVGDIDPGGVFAQLYGTWALLPEEEQERIRAFIINKFRGDQSLLDPGIRMLEERVGIPVLGVLPYMDLLIDDEDSLSIRLKDGEAGEIDIAVVRLPHMSNASDFTVFEGREGVSLRFIRSPDRLLSADLVILPGTKNTLADLNWLRKAGFFEPLRKRAEEGGLMAGICGGYQILGRSVLDPERVEGGGSAPGLGLLPQVTVMGRDKILTRVRGHFADDFTGPWSCLRNQPLEGYEIHQGQTQTESLVESKGLQSPGGREDLSWPRQLGRLRLDAGADWEEKGGSFMEGMVTGSVLGTYIHGVFDGKGVAEAVLNSIAGRRGLPLRYELREAGAFAEEQYDRLADAIEEHMDMERIDAILGL